MVFKDDSAVALLEINNEDWIGDLVERIDSLPPFWTDPLRSKWNEWLIARYGSMEGVAAAWGASRPVGKDVAASVLPDTGGFKGMSVYSAIGGDVRVDILEKPSVPWGVQLFWRNMNLAECAKSEDNMVLLRLQWYANCVHPIESCVFNRTISTPSTPPPFIFFIFLYGGA